MSPPEPLRKATVPKQAPKAPIAEPIVKPPPAPAVPEDVTATVTYDQATGHRIVHVQAAHPDETVITFNGRLVFKG